MSLTPPHPITMIRPAHVLHFNHAPDPARAPIAIGFSNGATMAACSWPVPVFRQAPFSSDVPHRSCMIRQPDWIARRYSWFTVGRTVGDHPGGGFRLAERLRDAGATVAHQVRPIGHSITSTDRQFAREWLERAS